MTIYLDPEVLLPLLAWSGLYGIIVVFLLYVRALGSPNLDLSDDAITLKLTSKQKVRTYLFPLTLLIWIAYLSVCFLSNCLRTSWRLLSWVCSFWKETVNGED